MRAQIDRIETVERIEFIENDILATGARGFEQFGVCVSATEIM